MNRKKRITVVQKYTLFDGKDRETSILSYYFQPENFETERCVFVKKIYCVNKQSRSCFLLLKVHFYVSTTPYSTCFTRRQDLEFEYP